MGVSDDRRRADVEHGEQVGQFLPDQQGWVVADRGAVLRYQRQGSAGWTDAGRDAALLPADATAVEVTRPAGTPVTVPLG